MECEKSMSDKNTKMMQRDLEVIWHPCTQTNKDYTR